MLLPQKLMLVTVLLTCGRARRAKIEVGYRGAKWRKQDEVDVKNSEEIGKSRPQARGAYLERLGDGGRALVTDRINSEFEVLQRLVDLPRRA